MNDPNIPEPEKRLLREVSVSVHRRDGMYQGGRPGGARHYLRVGLSAVRCLEAAIEAASSNGATREFRSILDMACGYGRVLRFLKVRFPGANIVACERDEDALAFCAATFSVSPIVSAGPFDNLTLPGPFDLIWCGSLVTHLDPLATGGLLRLCYRNLSVGGLCVFTTHGAWPMERIESGKQTYMLTRAGQRRVAEGYGSRGYGYADYRRTRGYGVSVATPQGIQNAMHRDDDWRQVLFLERGWDDHQDVYGFVRGS